MPPPPLRAATRALAGRGRAFHTTPLGLLLPYKDAQDRETLRPRSAEHTTSARDDDAAADVAFDRHKTKPEAERRADGRPLEASGANQGLSKPRGDERSSKDRGPGKEVNKGGRSGGGSAPKNG